VGLRTGERADENGRVAVAVLGSGNVATDLVSKLLDRPGLLELVLVAGVDPRSKGLAHARDLGVSTSHEGLDTVVQDPEIGVVFDATSARAHGAHAPLLEEAGKVAVDLTPASVGPYVVPVANLTEHLDVPNVSLATCAAQAAIPLAHAVSRVTPILYAEAVTTVASVSAGPATREDIDAFTRVTARGLERVGGARHGKAIVILSPADPPVPMRCTLYAVPEGDFDEAEIVASVEGVVAELQRSVPGYRLKGEPAFEARATRWGERRTVRLLVEVRGAGDFLPEFAGNLDVTTVAARTVGEQLARQLRPATEAAA
jgi:acetaldehyde dehydrogenase